MQQPVNIALYR